MPCIKNQCAFIAAFLPPRGDMFSLRLSVRVSVCPSVRVSVCPSVCVQDNSKTTGRIFLKFGRHMGID